MKKIFLLCWNFSLEYWFVLNLLLFSKSKNYVVIIVVKHMLNSWTSTYFFNVIDFPLLNKL